MTAATLIPDTEGGWLLVLPLDSLGSQLTVPVEGCELVDLGPCLAAAVAHGHGEVSLWSCDLSITADPNAAWVRADMGALQVVAVLPHPGLAELVKLVACTVEEVRANAV